MIIIKKCEYCSTLYILIQLVWRFYESPAVAFWALLARLSALVKMGKRIVSIDWNGRIVMWECSPSIVDTF